MRMSPRRPVAAKEDGFQLGDGEGIEVAVVSPIAAPLDRIGDAVIDERCSTYLCDTRGEQRPARVFADGIVPGAADWQVAFLEGVGEDEYTA